MCPPQAVDDIAVVWPLLDGGFDHLHRAFQMDPLVDPRVAEIVQDQRLVGHQLQRLEKIRFGLLPLFGPLMRDPARIQQRPMAFVDLVDPRKDAIVFSYRLREDAPISERELRVSIDEDEVKRLQAEAPQPLEIF